MRNDLIKRSMLVMVILVSLFNPAPITAGRILDIPPVQSGRSNWCWAACSKMTLEWYGIEKSQNNIAEWAIGSTTENRGLPFYSSTTTHEAVNMILLYYAVEEIGIITPLTEPFESTDVIREIFAKRPIVLSVSWIDPVPGGPEFHFMVIRGYEDDDAEDPTIYYNDPDTREIEDFPLSTMWYNPNVWVWEATLTFQNAGIGNVGVFDGVAIGGGDVFYNHPAVARTFTGRFVRAYGSEANAYDWLWTLSFPHANGEYTIATLNGPMWPSLSTTWNAPGFTLPSGYQWNYTPDGEAIGLLHLLCVDSDGYHHSDEKNVYYMPQNPYPMIEAYTDGEIISSHPEVKAHETVLLENFNVTSGGTVTFRSGGVIKLRNNVTLSAGSNVSLIVDPALR